MGAKNNLAAIDAEGSGNTFAPRPAVLQGASSPEETVPSEAARSG